VLTVLLGESADNLAHLFRFYAGSADKLLDVTYGAGTLSKRVPVPVVGVDKDPESSAQIIADSAGPLPFEDGSFGAAVLDPPYLYGAKAMHMGPVGQKTWSNVRSTWKNPNELREMAARVGRELARLVAPDGVLFVKIMDSRYRGKLIRNHDIVTEALEGVGFTLIDQIVYLRTVTGSFVNPRTAQSAHGYFLIFRRQRQRALPEVAA
jgi:SAM-dependent methyltransferase